MVGQKTSKSAKIFPLEKFRLYGTHSLVCHSQTLFTAQGLIAYTASDKALRGKKSLATTDYS